MNLCKVLRIVIHDGLQFLLLRKRKAAPQPGAGLALTDRLLLNIHNVTEHPQKGYSLTDMNPDNKTMP